MDPQLPEIVEQLVPRLGELDGDPTPLDGGITNRNFRATLGSTDYVIRVPGKDTGLLGIDRGAERTANERAAEAGVAPPVAAMLQAPPCLVTEFVAGEPMEGADLRKELGPVAAALRAVHDSGDVLPSEFDSFRVVEVYAETARERGAELPAAYEEAHGHAAQIEAALTGPQHDPVPCHNDLLAANFIRGEKIWIVDWEYAGMGDRFFDLGNFAVNNGFDEAGQRALLEAYFGNAERFADLRLMMFMSDFREAMWGVVQGAVSDLDFDFGEYADKHFARLREAAADSSFAKWLKEASAAG